MSAATQTTDTKPSNADTSTSPNVENAPASGEETTVIVNPVETISDAPNTTANTVEENSVTGNGSNVSSKYPKLNLRLNEFGIYELEPEEATASEKAEETTTVVVAKTYQKESTSSESVTTTQTTVTAEVIPPSTKPETTSTTSSSTISSTNNSNGDRERWKQRFPSNTMTKADIVCCKQCEGYGIADEFVDQNFCSEKCRKQSLARPAQSKNRESGAAGRVAVKRKSTSSNSSSQAGDNVAAMESSFDISVSNEGNKDSDSKGSKSTSSWSWPKYLERRRAQGAPERLFSDPFPYGKHGFRTGMKLEGIDPEHQSLFCVLTVVEVQGYRIRLHFDGYSDSHDYWLNADSENLFPCGWCEKNGQKLRPPKHYDLPQNNQPSSSPPSSGQQPAASSTHGRIFSWPQYLKFTSSVAAPRHLFISTQNEYPVPSAFRVKMKLEAVDRRHSSHTLCVATVANVIGSRFLVHFDGWDNIYDYWADPSCPYVHPVGWAQEHNTTLTPPCDYDAEEGEFSWDTYLAKTGATAVPPRAFKPRSPVGFKTGMKLECVDPRNPQLIRVATVAGVKGYRLKIHFDGWSSEYDFWTDDDWPDLHPPGWCLKTGHPLQPPLMTNGASKEGECPTPGCTGVGHVEGARYSTHSTAENCPYSARNLHRENPAFPDRLVGEEIDPAVQKPSSPVSGGITINQVNKEEPMKTPKTKLNLSESGTPSRTSSPLLPTSNAAIKSEPDAKKSRISQSIDLPVKSEAEAEQNNKLTQLELKPESPSEQHYDSLDALTPPPKKMKVSYFTGKVAASNSESGRRKSALTEDRDRTQDVNHDQSLPVSERRQQDESGRISSRGQNDHVEAVSTTVSSQARRMSMLNFPTNSNLTTPMCWTKHAALLGDLVGADTSAQVTRWSSDQVAEFLTKFGINKLLLEKFKQEDIDGEALLLLTQTDLTDLLGVKLGPAIKIRNALLLMKEKAKTAILANESQS